MKDGQISTGNALRFIIPVPIFRACILMLRSWSRLAAFQNLSASAFPNWLPEISACTSLSELEKWSIGTSRQRR